MEPDTRVELEATFKDGVPREFINLKKILKGSSCESLINRLSGYSCVQEALKLVCEAVDCYLELPEEKKPETVGRALWSYAVIQYGKCYKKSEGWTVKLEDSATLKDETQIMKDGHRWFIEQRDTFMAHGGKSFAQLSNVFVVRRKGSSGQVDGILANTLTAGGVTDESLKNLKHLAESSLLYVVENTKSLQKKIILELLKTNHPLSSDLLKAHGL